jgi:hypothetical protein
MSTSGTRISTSFTFVAKALLKCIDMHARWSRSLSSGNHRKSGRERLRNTSLSSYHLRFSFLPGCTSRTAITASRLRTIELLQSYRSRVHGTYLEHFLYYKAGLGIPAAIDVWSELASNKRMLVFSPCPVGLLDLHGEKPAIKGNPTKSHCGRLNCTSQDINIIRPEAI